MTERLDSDTAPRRAFRSLMRACAATAVVAMTGTASTACTQDLTMTPQSAPTESENSAAGPLDGVFEVTLGLMTKNRVPSDAPAAVETWALRSACSAGGCRATASVIDPSQPGAAPVREFILDQVAPNRWLTIERATETCSEGADFGASTPVWRSVSFQPLANGTYVGSRVEVGASNCYGLFERPVSIKRIGDVDPTMMVADPLQTPERDPRLAESFHGAYAFALKDPGEETEDAVDRYIVQVDTQCLRDADECRTVAVRGDEEFFYELYPYADGKWTLAAGLEETPCDSGGVAYGNFSSELILPNPVDTPIKQVLGTQYRIYTGDCSGEVGFDVSFLLTSA